MVPKTRIDIWTFGMKLKIYIDRWSRLFLCFCPRCPITTVGNDIVDSQMNLTIISIYVSFHRYQSLLSGIVFRDFSDMHCLGWLKSDQWQIGNNRTLSEKSLCILYNLLLNVWGSFS